MLFGLMLALPGCDRAPAPKGGADTTDAGASTPVAGSYAVPAAVADMPAPAQPLPYSHRTHAGDLALDCRLCHVGDAGEEAGASRPESAIVRMTFPSTATCMTCHENVATVRPAIARLRQFHEDRETIPWVRVYRVLPGVRWAHGPHLAAGVACTDCHGDVPALEHMQQTTAVTAMSVCLGCHAARGAPTACETCHAWPTDAWLAGMRE
ncbi:MAG: cytochrome c3 family protein [Rhodothalassiaceae bacterium]